MIDLLCDENQQGFYATLGMGKSQGMMIRNFSVLKEDRFNHLWEK